jgi:hypothetical protein
MFNGFHYSSLMHAYTCVRNIITPVLITALFTIAKIWEQPNCVSTVNRLRKGGEYTHRVFNLKMNF